MKTFKINYILGFTLGLSFICPATAQTYGYLDINNVKARINANNFLFYDPVNSIPGLEYPINSGKYTFFMANLEMLGEDVSAQLRGMVPHIGNSTDLYAGPIMDPQYYATSAQAWDRVWKIDCATIQTFKDWYQAGVDDALNGTNTQATNFPGYTIPASITDWPAHGDISKGQALNIAPFFDNDGDSFYDPNAGDYPLIKGDQAIFYVYNDERPNWSITPGRIEVHVMAYAFGNTLDSALNNTIFLNYEIFNRSSSTLNNFYIGLDTDMDIGNPTDDYMGSDVARDAFYTCNGDTFDENNSGLMGYGSNLAAQSVVMLNGPYMDNDGLDNPYTIIVQDAIDSAGFPYERCTGLSDGIVDNETFGLEHFMQYQGSTGSPTGAPLNGIDFYSYFKGLWKDGTSLVYGGNGHSSGGGTVPAKYMFSGTSDPFFWNTQGISAIPSNWSEANEGNPAGDRHGMGSTGPFTFDPGAIMHLDLAFVSAIDYTGSGPQASVAIMNERIDSVKSYFCSGLISNCASGMFSTAVETHTPNVPEFSVAPNPFNDQLTIYYQLKNNEASLEVYNLIGEQISSQLITENISNLNLSTLVGGIYFIKIIDGNTYITRKIIKQ